MNNLKRLVVILTLTSVLALTALAGETQAPPCATGQTSTPPCSSAQQATDDPVVPPEQTVTPPAADTLDLPSVVTDVLLDLLLF